MNVLLTTLNAKYIHKNLALRYLYVTKPDHVHCEIREFTIKDDPDRIIEELLKRNDDVIAFSTYIWNSEQTCRIVRELKQIRPDTVIVLGGPEVSFDAQYFLDLTKADAVICGEGEFAFWQYLTQVNRANPLSIPGVFTQTSQPEIPYAIADLRKLEQYPDPYFLSMDQQDMANRYLYIETSRGCPYHCRYCLSSVQGGVRMFSASYVKKILRQIFRSPVRQIKFLDRTFNVDRKRALEFASLIQSEARQNQIFQFEIMAEHLSEAMIRFLKEKPKYPQFRFEIGIQSTNAKALHEIDRIQDFERLRDVVMQLQETGHYELHVDLIAALPYEDKESFKKSFDDVFGLHASELQLGFLKLLRGTTLRDDAKLYGMEYDDKAPYEVFCTSWMSHEDLKEIHEAAYAVEVLYNSGRLRQTCDAVLRLTKMRPYDLFLHLGHDLIDPKFRQLDELFARVYRCLSSIADPKLAAGLLANDYYALFKQRPKRFHDGVIKNELRHRVYELLSNRHTINEMMHYGMFDVAYYEENQIGKSGYQFILYNKEQTYPVRYLINEDCSAIIALWKGDHWDENRSSDQK